MPKRLISPGGFFRPTIFVLLAIIGFGCSHNDVTRSPAVPDSYPPVLSVTLASRTDGGLPGRTITLSIEGQARDEGIAKWRISVDGCVQNEDSGICSPPTRVFSRKESILIPAEPDDDSILEISVTIFDSRGDSSKYEHMIMPFDTTPPEMILMHDSSLAYTPGEAVSIHAMAQDDQALSYFVLRTGGAYEWEDTIYLAQPYPVRVDTHFVINLPNTSYNDITISFEATAYDAGLNATTVTLDHNIRLTEKIDPKISVRFMTDTADVRNGDMVKFWVIGRARVPLKTIGYTAGFSSPLQSEELTQEYLPAADSALFSMCIPDSEFCHNRLTIVARCEDAFGNTNWSQLQFCVSNRIRLDQAVEIPVEGYISQILVDSVRGVVYLVNRDLDRIDVYSPASYSIIGSFAAGDSPVSADFAFGGKQLIVSNFFDLTLTIIDLARVDPAPVSTIDLSQYGEYPVSTLRKVVTTADNRVIVLIDGSPHVVDLSNGSVESPDWLNKLDRISNIAISSDRKILVMGSFDNYIYRYDFIEDILSTTPTEWPAHVVACNDDGSLIWAFTLDYDHRNALFDGNLSLLKTFDLPSCYVGFTFGVFAHNRNEIFNCSLVDAALSIIDADGLFLKEQVNFETDQDVVLWSLALNRANDRLFLAVMTSPGDNGFSLFDIPVRPK